MFENLREKLKHFCVGIAGVGGLGSNCAVSLARTGIGKLIIADFDVVSESNLNRQYYFRNQIGQKKVFALQENIEKITTETIIEPHFIKLSPDSIISLFKNCEIIIEAFDLADQKQMLIETVLSEMPEKYVISGNGMAGFGRNNAIKTQQFDHLFICGDFESEISDSLPPLSPRVCVVANLQANQALEILLENF